jgi:hypothetical protein
VRIFSGRVRGYDLSEGPGRRAMTFDLPVDAAGRRVWRGGGSSLRPLHQAQDDDPVGALSSAAMARGRRQIAFGEKDWTVRMAEGAFQQHSNIAGLRSHDLKVHRSLRVRTGRCRLSPKVRFRALSGPKPFVR